MISSFSKALLLFLLGAALVQAEEESAPPKSSLTPTREIAYKQASDRELKLFVFEPAGFKPSDRRPCFLAIHGGGWGGGNALWTHKIASFFANKGMVGISLDYRLYNRKNGVSVADCVRDGRSAMRYLRTHAPELGIDPSHIVVGGVSAGGHIAAGTALFDGIDEEGEDVSISSTPAALVLFCPVLDTSAEGYGFRKVGQQWQELSGVLRVRPGVPPTLIFHTKEDKVVPYKGSVAFSEAMSAAGNKCELVSYEEGKHCFMTHDPVLLKAALEKSMLFLQSAGISTPTP